MCFLLAILNPRGGVGKTTTALNLGASLATSGKRVLLVDIDPQGMATYALSRNSPAQRSLLSHWLEGNYRAGGIVPTPIEGLDLLPSATELSMLQQQNHQNTEARVRLQEGLKTVAKPYDFALLDLPPTPDSLGLSFLPCCDLVLIPTNCDAYSMETMQKTIELIRSNVSEALKITDRVRILLTEYEPEQEAGRTRRKDLQNLYRKSVMRCTIPKDPAFSDPAAGKQSLLGSNPDSKGARAYIEAAKEVLNLCRKNA